MSGHDQPPPDGTPPGHGYGYGPAPGWGQPPYPPPYPVYYPPSAFTPPPPTDSGATLALVLGIVAVAGGFVCYLPVLAAPFAWVVGHRSRRRIEHAQGALGGQGMATAGWILGIVGTVLLALAVVVLVVFLVIGLSGGFDDPSPTYDDGDLGATLGLLVR